jgi:hypothetical protein
LNLTTSFYFRIYRDILKNKMKDGPQYVVSAIVLVKINERKIGTVNPPFFARVRSLNLYVGGFSKPKVNGSTVQKTFHESMIFFHRRCVTSKRCRF